MMTITRNKTRSILTAFGVFWGIFMLIVLIGGGNGMRVLIGRSFSSFATNSCFVSSHLTSEAYKGFRKGRYWSLNVKDVDILRSNIPEIAYIVPMLFSRRGDNNILYEDKFFTGAFSLSLLKNCNFQYFTNLFSDFFFNAFRTSSTLKFPFAKLT